MDVSVALEMRFSQTPDGTVWTPHVFAYTFWTRYLTIFENVHVIARTKPVSEVPTSWVRSSGERVFFSSLPHFVGPMQFLRKIPELGLAIRESTRAPSAVILRIPGVITSLTFQEILRLKKPFAVEVVADAFDNFSPGALKHFLRPVFRKTFTYFQKQQCSRACAAAYVTAEALQKRYPANPESYITNYSDVELTYEAIVKSPRTYIETPKPLRLLTIGSMDLLYKGHDILMKALVLCLQKGFQPVLTLVGDGMNRAFLEEMSRALGISDRISFTGELSAGNNVRKKLDEADLFVLPSRQEGLPRALIEAMARGLPSVGSRVGGIPQLLLDEDMVPPGNAIALATKIMDIASNPLRMSEMSKRNVQRAGQYTEQKLRDRRDEFYSYVRDRTAECQ